VQFLADEHFPRSSITRLHAAGHDVVAVAERMPGATDAAILATAATEGRVVLTFDSDFGALIFRSRRPAPAGVVYFRFDPATPLEPAERLLRFLAQPDIVVLHTITVIDDVGYRQRPFPEPADDST
jgi:predicted nuclease of predicted toxin-antitoxin system